MGMNRIMILIVLAAAVTAISAVQSQGNSSLNLIGTMPFTAFQVAEAAMPEVQRRGVRITEKHSVSVYERQGEFIVIVGWPTDPNVLGNPSPDPLGTLEVHLDKKTLKVIRSNFAR